MHIFYTATILNHSCLPKVDNFSISFSINGVICAIEIIVNSYENAHLVLQKVDKVPGIGAAEAMTEYARTETFQHLD